MSTIHRSRLALALALALATTTAPALARPSYLIADGSDVPAGSPSMHSPAARPAGAQSAPPTIVRVSSRDNGFDWGDAGIGAAGGLAISMIGLGTTLAVTQNRARRTPA
jgi:hypothetical protein